LRPLSASTRALLAVGCACAGAVTLLWASDAPGVFFSTDFGAWGKDPGILAECMASGTRPCAPISHFALAYLVNAWVTQSLAASGVPPAYVLAGLNAVILALPAALMPLFQPRRAVVAALAYLLLLWATPLPRFYVASGALELQHGVLLGILIACSARAVERSSTLGWPVGVATNLLSAVVLLYKDTTLPLLAIALGLVLALPMGRVALAGCGVSRALRLWGPGVLLGTLAQAAYNWVRYDSVLPAGYLLYAEAATPTLVQRGVQLFWLIASRNGGVIVFWGLAITLVAAICLLARLRPSRIGVAYSVALGVTSLGVLSSWWAAFGWDAWGGRLFIPFGLAFVISSGLTLDAARPSSAAGDRSALPRSLWLLAPGLAALAVALSFRYVAIGYRVPPEVILVRSLFSQPECREMVAAIQAGAPEVQGLLFSTSDPYWACAGARFRTDPFALVEDR
jgi:hypothetical protein